MALSAQSVAHSSWQLPPALAPPPVSTISLPHSNESPSSESTDVDATRSPLCNDASSASSEPYPPLFVAAELQCLSDPLPMSFAIQLAPQVVVLARKLPDDGLDSQARVLQLIIECIRVDGYKSCYYFKGRSLDELRATLLHDEAFSNAIRVLFGNNFAEFGQMIMLVLRHVCRRPPSDRSRKVQFAQEPQFVDADDMLEDAVSDSASCSASSPRVYPPFVLDDASQLPDPYNAGSMIHLTALAYKHAKDLGVEADGDVRVAQLLFDLQQQLGLVTSPAPSGLDAATLRDCVQRDRAFSESLRGLLGPAVPPSRFVVCLFPIIRYMWFSLF
ncbi:hypothetical protein AURDEDRAFT_115615, partial [Auricularia subglabra TFB-10046 SS5]